jgi:hypothetical protein
MLLIVEIALTVFAWRNGWKWLALMPIGIALLLGLMIGFTIGTNGGNAADARGIALVLDVLAIIALAVMCGIKGNKTSKIEVNKTE